MSMKVDKAPARASVWREEKQTLDLAIGGRTVKKVKFQAAVLTTHFSQLSTDVDEIAPPWNELPKHVELVLVPEHPVAGRYKRLEVSSSHLRTIGSSMNRYFVNLETSFEDYLAKFRSKPRKNLLRTIQRFKDVSGGEIVWRRYSSPSEIETFFSLADEVHAKSWQGTIAKRPFSEWLGRRGVIDLASRGEARGYALFQQQHALAIAYCETSGDIFSYFAPRYDPEYERVSPGTVLLYLILESVFAERKFRLFDFGFGLETYKEFFSTDHVPCAIVRYFRRTPKCICAVMVESGISALSRSTGKVLETIRVKRLLKKALLGPRARPGIV